MVIFIIISVIVVIGLIIVFGFISSRNKFRDILIKVNEAETNIDLALQKKHDLLEKSIPIVSKEIEKDDFLYQLVSIKKESIDQFMENDILRECYSELFKVIDDNDKLLKNEELLTIYEGINLNEEDLIASIKYYNDSVVIYNELIHSFPSSFYKIFLHEKEKEFYKIEKREIFEILKED